MNPAIVAANRRALNAIENWIAPEDYENSRDRYGCPEELLPLLAKPIGSDLIYTDLIVHAATLLQQPLNYLEIGVSVGKNFYAVSEALKHSLLVGIDWEPFNPAIRSRFKAVHAQPPVFSYTNGRNMIRYIEGDLFDDSVWRRMAGTRFQLVFSDASHHPNALRHEFDMLRKHALLDHERLFMIWDDLDRDPDGELSRTFFEICEDLADLTGASTAKCYLTGVNGWLGEHEHQHTVGIFNTIGVDEHELLAPEG